ncbi:carboxymuconolactone decarboxylase family protein [Lysobacter pythonis]|uniref:Carboxymuconolactone decarboxylase family protein n=1 Tax=Solilutibacter pythonis TaxID=2483112 RepID=A0A3M2HVN0_9GAMM|nr:carboxymuconolactone decarboxylase family protein [Lysobacter pythonis]RMH93801.1 carboxymuconolactone decarboxylase family protein [Lysobacter pythonis]
MTRTPITMEAGLQRIETLLGKDSRASMERAAHDTPLTARAEAIAVGEIYGEHGTLDLKTRELVTVAVLAARGDAAPQLRVHLQGARNAGASRAEIFATLDQLHPYTGLPVALNAIRVAREFFDQAGDAR